MAAAAAAAASTEVPAGGESWSLPRMGAIDNLVRKPLPADYRTRTPQRGFVRVAVRAVGLNFADVRRPGHGGRGDDGGQTQRAGPASADWGSSTWGQPRSTCSRSLPTFFSRSPPTFFFLLLPHPAHGP